MAGSDKAFAVKIIAFSMGILLIAGLSLCMRVQTAHALSSGDISTDQNLLASEFEGTSMQAQASSNKEANVTLISRGNRFTNATFKGYDITGDGKADSIKFVATGISNSFAKTLRVYVNNKLCCTAKGQYGNGFIVGNVTAKYLRMKNGKPFLLLKCDANNGDGSHDVLQYMNGKLKSVASCTILPEGFGNHRQIDDAVASGNTIKVTFHYMTLTAGSVKMTYDYKLKKGKLTKSSVVSSGLSYYASTSTERGYGQAYVQARKTFKTYASTNLKKAKFKVKTNQQVRITKARFTSKALYLRITTKSGKSGWMRALTKGLGRYGGETLFAGTYTAG